jgi:hypothetical protein
MKTIDSGAVGMRSRAFGAGEDGRGYDGAWRSKGPERQRPQLTGLCRSNTLQKFTSHCLQNPAPAELATIAKD